VLTLLIKYSMSQSHLEQFILGIFHSKIFDNLDKLPSSFIKTIFFCSKNIKTLLSFLICLSLNYILKDKNIDRYQKKYRQSKAYLHKLFLTNFQDLFLICWLRLSNLYRSLFIFLSKKLFLMESQNFRKINTLFNNNV